MFFSQKRKKAAKPLLYAFGSVKDKGLPRPYRSAKREARGNRCEEVDKKGKKKAEKAPQAEKEHAPQKEKRDFHGEKQIGKQNVQEVRECSQHAKDKTAEREKIQKHSEHCREKQEEAKGPVMHGIKENKEREAPAEGEEKIKNKKESKPSPRAHTFSAFKSDIRKMKA